MEGAKDVATNPSTKIDTATSIKQEDLAEDHSSDEEKDTKNLTSKEKRQLRNKVSARAFRSRRKEYIGQLESEIEEKEKEVAGLHNQHKELTEENRKLLDTTKKMLSSKAFKGFLAEANQAQKAQKLQQDAIAVKKEVESVA